MVTSQSSVGHPLRVKVFVDFWNFTLSMRSVDPTFKVDWHKLGHCLAREAGLLIDYDANVLYEGMHVYGSYDPNKSQDGKLKHWFLNTLDKLPGVHAVIQERQRKRGFPRCPACQAEVFTCAVCGSDMRGTEEKGVDTRIATDMTSLAWANGYTCAVLVSSDRDFGPVVEVLQMRSIKVVHAAFPPAGSQLMQRCWGHLHVPDLRGGFARA